MVLGAVSGTRGDQREAIKHLKQALSINPNEWDAILWLLTVYYTAGKASAAWALADRLMEIDPLNPWTPFMRGVIYIQCEGRFDLAAELLQRNRELLDLPFFRSYVAYALAGARRFKDALALLGPIEPTSDQDAFSVQACLSWRLALQGRKEKMREVISSEYFATVRRDAGYSLITADLYAMLDDREQALDWLENAVNRGYINYPYLSEYDPFLSKLRSDPRFRKLMVRVKQEWERFEV